MIKIMFCRFENFQLFKFLTWKNFHIGGSDTVLFVPVTNEKSWPADVFLGQKGQIMGQKGQNH